MAVTMVHEMPGANEDMYNKILSNMGMPPEGQLADGQIAHIAAPMDGGWRVVDVWESEEAFSKFAQTRLGPAMAAAGGPADAPPPKFYPVRNYNSRKG